MTKTFPRLVEKRTRQILKDMEDGNFNAASSSIAYNSVILEYAAKHPAAIAALVEGTACVMPVKHIDTLILKIQQWQSAQGYVADPSDWLEETYNYMLAAGRLDKEGA